MKRVIKLAPNNGDFPKQPGKIAKENASAVKTDSASSAGRMRYEPTQIGKGR
jgi:hypothetical protein